MAPSLIRELGQQVHPENVYVRPADLAAYSYDSTGASGLRATPAAVVFPGSAEEVRDVLAVCRHFGVAVVPRGAGTGYAGGAIGEGAVILSLARLRRIAGLETEAARILAEAGVTTASIHRAAEAAGQYYPPDPGSATTSTIGGNVACNASGPHALKYGATADYVVGATAVLADGSIVRMGEGAGNHDLLALMLASEGTLGVITEVLLRLIPKPIARSTIAATFASMDDMAGAVAAVTTAGVVPAALECLDEMAVELVSRTTGWKPGAAGPLLIAEVEGTEAEVQQQSEAVVAALQKGRANSVERAASEADAARLWSLRKAISAAVATVMVGKINEDVVVPRDAVGELVRRSREVGAQRGFPVVTFGHIGDGNIHVTVICDPRVPGERERAEAAAAEIFDVTLGLGGSLSGEHGIGTTKLPYLERQLGSEGMAVMRRIKESLDPTGLLNPGKKLPVAAETAPA